MTRAKALVTYGGAGIGQRAGELCRKAHLPMPQATTDDTIVLSHSQATIELIREFAPLTARDLTRVAKTSVSVQAIEEVKNDG